MTTVNLVSTAKKELNKIPEYIELKFYSWVKDVEEFGLSEVRKVPGLHDEELKGKRKRKNQRSIRLSKSYRAIYESTNDEAETIEVEEVNKHKY